MPHDPAAASLSARPPNRFRSRASLTAMAAAGVVIAPAVAEAQIVYSGVLNTVVPVSGTLTLRFQGTPTDGSELILSVTTGKKGATTVAVKVADFNDTAIVATPVTWGATVDAGRTFTTPAANLGGVLNESYYYAFSYSPDGEDMYGWFHYTVGSSVSPPSITLNDWAYNSVPGGSITAGQTVALAIPEPADFGVLLGVAALAAIWVCRRPRGAARRS